MAIFKGAGVAIVTPMYEDGKVNYDKLEELLEYQIANSTDAIIICGTTGEASTLTHEEHIETIRFAADRVKDEGIHQFNKQGQKAVKTTQDNIGKAKDKITDFKQSRAVKAAEQKAAQNMSEQHGLQIRHGAASRSAAPDVSQTAKSQLIKTRQQGQKMIKTTARNAEKAVKSTAKGTVKTTEKGIKTLDNVPSGDVYVDGIGVGDVGNIVLRDRQHLSEDGIMIVVMTLERHSNVVLAGPDIVSRGFVYVRESEDLMEHARQVVETALDSCLENNITDWGKIKTEVKDALGEYLWKRTKRSPMILPIIMEV